ncbi:hypothetical protein ACGFMM_19590 [Streptomyces sp. NPDC048604]|uniref:hypothetical protein n=1 Tax=Streptomyces sp. NPDC048604 TaxID=3365578 RepID=UPI0037158E5A
MLLWAGLAAAAAGAVLCVVGWYGMSGERFAERQLPWLASGTVPGAALLVAGAVLVAGVGVGPPWPPEAGRDTARATEPPADEPPWKPSSADPPLRVPGGTLAHRPDCPLVAGKPEAVPAGDEELDPCPVCEPWPR